MHHDKICLLRNKWLAAVVALVCIGNGILNLFRLVHRIPAIKHDPLAPFWFGVSVLILVYVWKLFTCPSEKLTLVLISLLALVKLIALVQPELIDDSHQRIIAVLIWFICAGIVAFALLVKGRRRLDTT
jgi:hypothetical protein